MFKYFIKLLDWSKIVLSLEQQNKPVLFKEAEIWWCHVGLNVGTEIFGKGKEFARPVLIFKKISTKSFLGIPLTSQQKEGSWYIPIQCEGREGRAILSQIKVFDVSRLIVRSEAIPENEFLRINRAFSDFYCTGTEENFPPASGEAGGSG